MSSGTRPPSYADKRSSNGAATDRAASRPRMSAPDGPGTASASAGNSFRSSDPRVDYSTRRQQQQQQQPAPSGYASTSASASAAHKRTTSGNARATNKTVEERRTERTQVTTRETLITRTKSPERRTAAPSEKSRGSYERPRQPPVETRPKEQRPEAPPQGMYSNFTISCPLPFKLSLLMKSKWSTAPWEPEATLLPHTSAPLATRISIPPLVVVL